MSWSAAEILALATKAARGAGAPPAQAERFGHVAARHLVARRDPAVLSDALDALPAGPILEMAFDIDRCLCSGNLAGQEELKQPSDGSLLRSYVEVLPFTADVVVRSNAVFILEFDMTTPRARPASRRIIGCAQLVQAMSELAASTFVPESESSRADGAGAGLNDND